MQLFDTFKEAVFLLLFRDLLDTIKLHDHGWRKQMGRFVDGIITSKYLEHTRGYFYRGLRDVEASRHATHPIARVRIKELQEYASRRISWLTDRVLDTIESLALQGHGQEYIRSALDSFAFRANFLDRTIKRQSRTYGQAIGLLLSGYDHAYIFRTPVEEDEECTECDKFHGKRISLEYLSVTDLPPWHDNCECKLSLYPEPKFIIDTTVDTVTDSSSTSEDLNPKVERCVISVKADLIKRHPTWSEGRIKSSAIAICRAAFEPGVKKNSDKQTAGEKMNSKCLKVAKADLRKKYPKLSAKQINSLAQELCKMHAVDPPPTVLV
jgi:hypothetical protein